MTGECTPYNLTAVGSRESVAPIPSKLTASQAVVHAVRKRKGKEGGGGAGDYGWCTVCRYDVGGRWVLVYLRSGWGLGGRVCVSRVGGPEWGIHGGWAESPVEAS
jgi:hypothetical protein